jgi:signal transduction histidine kinase
MRGVTSSAENALEMIIELFHDCFPINQCLLLLRKEPATEKVCYVRKQTRTTSIILNLCNQLLEQNQSLLKQNKIITWSKKDRENAKVLKNLGELSEIESLLIVPLFYQEYYLGEICLAEEKSQYLWTDKELLKLRNLANQSALTLHQSQELAYLQNKLNLQQSLQKIYQKLNLSVAPETILSDTIREVGIIFQVEQVCLGYLNNIQIQIQQEWRIDEQVPTLINRKISLVEWLAFLEIDYEQTSICSLVKLLDSILVREKFLNLEIGTVQAGNLISVPIWNQGNLLGLLILQTQRKKQQLINSNFEQLQEIGNLISIIFYYIEHQDQWVNQQIENLNNEKRHLEIAKQKNSEFLDHTIHELRSPLTGILSFARILQEQIYGSLNQKQTEYLDVIVSSGKHMLSLINDFLDLSKIEASREEIILDTMAVEDVCLASIAMVKSRAEEVGIDLKFEIDRNVDFCKADQKRIKQILVNLLTNAIKFTEVGSVTLQVKQHRNQLEFRVIDTGIGIKPEDQDKLFQPFQQIKNRLSYKHKGTGLGLALSRRYAQLHGGDITLVSAENKGSCFRLHLPL